MSDSQDHRRRLKAEYGQMFYDVRPAISAADPIGLIEIGCPDDEYEPEISTILPRLVKAGSIEAVRRLVYEEFVHWFGECTAGAEESYEELSESLWALSARRDQGVW